jgi:alkanesulfonate monooxygenase SsuD/methylene tetrahydromethanopterin reductase-like flavin-dependent oxidoreductase (luciferase family)
VLAKMAATLDHLSHGRAELGIGAGWLEAEHRAFGFDFPEPPRRVDLVEEQLQIITGLWREDPFNHDGRAYHLRDAHFTPKPVQQPRPTVIVGGRTTSERLPKLAARFGDEYVVGQPLVDDCHAVRARLDRACEARGRDPSTLKLSAFVPFCVGSTEAEVQQRLETFRTTNAQYAGMMANMATWLMGTPDQVQSQLHNLEQAGIDRVMLAVNGDLHREMLPLLRA